MFDINKIISKYEKGSHNYVRSKRTTYTNPFTTEVKNIPLDIKNKKILKANKFNTLTQMDAKELLNSNKIINLDRMSKNYFEEEDWIVKCPKCGSQFYRNANINRYGALTCPNEECNYSGEFKFIKKV
jgi:hypothetical protein